MKNPLIDRLGFFIACAGAALVGLSGCETVRLDPPAPRIIEQDKAAVTDDREIVVLVNTNRALSNLKRGAVRRGYRVREENALPALRLFMVTMEIPGGMSGARAISELEAIEPTATAGVNHSYTVEATTRVEPHMEYADRLIEWPEAGCTAIEPIGLIDTGVEVDALWKTNATVISKSFVPSNSVSTVHGTEVAAVMVAGNRLHDTSVYNAAVVNVQPNGTESAGVDRIALALNWLLENDVRVVNISLAGPYNKILERSIDRSVAEGMILVAAVGNHGAGSPPRYPAAFPDVLAVTAIDAGRNIYQNAVRGDHVDLAAPGVDVYLPIGADGHFATGTSIAAPLISARIASDAGLLDAGNAAMIKMALEARVQDLGAPGSDPTFGAGLVQFGGQCQSLG